MWQEIVQLFLVLFIFLGVLGMTYYTTKKIGMAGKGIYSNKNIEIIEAIGLMQGQYLYIVKVGKKYVLLSCSKNGITYLSEIEEEDLDIAKEQKKSFQEYIHNRMKGKQVEEDEK